MKIKLDSLIITNYCSTDKGKYCFIKEISEDPLINQFVSHTMDEWLEDSEGVDRLLIGPAYIIEEQRKLIGIIRLASLDDMGVLNLHYGIHPAFRKQHYGTKILKEVPKYIFNSMSSVKQIELHIKEINTGSIRCAENTKFEYEREFKSRQDDCMIKVYVKNSGRY